MIPRLRIFAGPNGSGKSTLAKWLSQDYAVNLYRHINADILFAEIRKTQKTACPFPMDTTSLQYFVQTTTFPEEQKRFFQQDKIRVEEESIVFEQEAINSYTVALLAEYFRHECLSRLESFSFETVFSHPSKIDILQEARQKGYRTYLYFVATENPQINLTRIASRVLDGGHDVPTDKIVARYKRCLDNAAIAITHLNRVFFFDNTGINFRFIAEINEGNWTLYTSNLPLWFTRYFQRNQGN